MKSEHNKLGIVIITAMMSTITNVVITYYIAGMSLSELWHLIFIKALGIYYLVPILQVRKSR